jgi:NAD(P)H-nitrite reductase large subunit
MIKNYLIIGASAAGIGCALRLRMLDAMATITVLNAESDLPYNKCLLADVLLQEKFLDDITFCNKAMLAQKQINLVCDAKVVAIEPENKTVSTGDGQTFTYDSLCIAVGRSPLMLPLFKDANLTNLFNFYYKSDLENIIKYINCSQARSAIVIGGGLTGLEAADGLRARGLKVTIVESAENLLPSLVNSRAASVIRAHVEAAGAVVLASELVISYETVDNCITALHTQSGREISADLVVCAIGARPNTSFLPADIALQDGYCVVSDTLQTSMPSIYAVGDCCTVYDQLTKRVQPSLLWPDAMQQGMCAAYGMTGISKQYAGSVSIAASGFFGIKVAVAGPMVVARYQQIEESSEFGWYHRFVYEQDTLIGFMLIGNTSELSQYRRQILSQ